MEASIFNMASKSRVNAIKLFFKGLFFILLGAYLVFSPSGVVRGETSVNTLWQSLETKYTVIRYHSLEDLNKFDKKIDYSPGEWGISRLFSSSGSESRMDKIGEKIDALYERVQEILDMRKKTKKLKINIYKDKNQLKIVYNKTYKKSHRAYKSSRHPRAWYIHTFKTIYINVDDLHEGMLAHEMAHSIIDHYLLVRPPPVAAEILARYVDAHLFDRGR